MVALLRECSSERIFVASQWLMKTHEQEHDVSLFRLTVYIPHAKYFLYARYMVGQIAFYYIYTLDSVCGHH